MNRPTHPCQADSNYDFSDCIRCQLNPRQKYHNPSLKISQTEYGLTSFFTANHFFEVLDVSLHGTSCQTVLSLSAPLRTTSLPMRTTTSTSPSSTRRRLSDAQAAPCHADTGSTHWPNPVPLLRHSCRLVVSCSGTPPPTWWRRRRSSSSPSSPWSVSWGELLVFSWDFPSLAFLILHLLRFPLQLASLLG